MSIMNLCLSRIVLPFRESMFINIIQVYICIHCIENASDIIKCPFNFQTDQQYEIQLIWINFHF